MIELEKTYLAKYLPDLSNCKKKEIIDIYIPKSEEHPKLRIRKNGDSYEMTKKVPICEDKGHQRESTIELTEEEFKSLSQLDGKKTHKIRYLYEHDGRTAEFDVFQDQKKGLVVIDFEFDDVKTKDVFEMPDFCLVDITQEDFIAGGMICGKSYDDLRDDLEGFDYKPLNL